MNNRSVSTEVNITKIYEYLLYLFIIIAPIINSLKIWFFGYGLHIYVCIFIIILTLFVELIFKNQKSGTKYFSGLILIMFIFSLIFTAKLSKNIETGLIFNILIYIAFLRIPGIIPLRKIYMSFYISSIIAAIYTVIAGYTETSVSRTATSVDGSIAIIGIAIILFAEESFRKNNFYNSLKFASFFSCLIVALFGMSRARLFLIAALFAFKLFLEIGKAFKTGGIKKKHILLIPVICVAAFFALRLSVVQELLSTISERFSEGFQSIGRTEEIQIGWNWFKDNVFFGCGWGTLSFVDYHGAYSPYYNHCMYVALLTRGGIILAIPFYLSFASLIRGVIKRKNMLAFVILAAFLALGYGNAGLFNFTICSFLIPLICILKTENDKMNNNIAENEI